MYGTLLLLHVLAATIWTGGHLVLALTVLPRVLRERSPAELLRFESAYERIGLPALGVQGRYVTSGSMAGSLERSLVVTDYLLERARKGA